MIHKGWFLFAPVYVDMADPECPGMWSRWAWMEFTITWSHWLQEGLIGMMSAMNPEYEPALLLWITGEAPDAEAVVQI